MGALVSCSRSLVHVQACLSTFVTVDINGLITLIFSLAL